jgi:SAM-dependent methyltransferase
MLAGTQQIGNGMIEVCAEAVPHIVRQRTELAEGDVIENYKKDVDADIQQVRAYLPKKCGSILGIGCGMAGVEIGLAKLCAASLIMMDGDGEGTIQAGYWNTELETWNDTKIAKAQAQINGVDASVQKPDPQATIPCDLIVSLLSWCHHYPAEHYMGLAMRSLQPGGRLIVDCRKGKGNVEKLARHFEPIGRLPMRGINARKSERCIFEAR